jgi:hypothetical protein
MVERSREEQLVHYFAIEARQLACGFVGAHVNWTIDARAVDCPRCKGQLSRRDAPRDLRAAAETRA